MEPGVDTRYIDVIAVPLFDLPLLAEIRTIRYRLLVHCHNDSTEPLTCHPEFLARDKVKPMWVPVLTGTPRITRAVR